MFYLGNNYFLPTYWFEITFFVVVFLKTQLINSTFVKIIVKIVNYIRKVPQWKYELEIRKVLIRKVLMKDVK